MYQCCKFYRHCCSTWSATTITGLRRSRGSAFVALCTEAVDARTVDQHSCKNVECWIRHMRSTNTELCHMPETSWSDHTLWRLRAAFLYMYQLQSYWASLSPLSYVTHVEGTNYTLCFWIQKLRKLLMIIAADLVIRCEGVTRGMEGTIENVNGKRLLWKTRVRSEGQEGMQSSGPPVAWCLEFLYYFWTLGRKLVDDSHPCLFAPLVL